MARPKKTQSSSSEEFTSSPTTPDNNNNMGDMVGDFAADLMKQVNKEVGQKIMFNLGAGDAPTVVHRWISTGSKQLDYIIGNMPKVGGGLPEGRIIEIQGPTGCHRKGDKVLTSTGEEVEVQNVKVGDKLLGSDGSPRTVLNLVRGKTDSWYQIQPTKNGKVYTVNADHILSLVKADSSSAKKIEISVKDYLDKNPSFKNAHKLYHAEEIEFCQSDNIEHPYSLGLEAANSLTVTESYKTSSIKNRLHILAAFLDFAGDHNPEQNNFVYSSKSSKLRNDVAFISRSLGLCVSVSGDQLTISGDIDKIPTRLKRKQVTVRLQKKNPLLSGFAINKISLNQSETYYGFTLDKDNLYLTDDFTVFHNCGKSHIAFEISKNTQRAGGLVVYVDTENATSISNLQQIGINVKKNFAFVQTSCTEEVFKVIETTILKARELNKDIPVTVIWDSVANTSPKAELEGDYDQNTIGLQARVLGKGFRKITNVIGGQHVVLVCLQQQREKIGVMYGDPCLSPHTTIKIRRKL